MKRLASPRGFTLTELMISMVVGSIVLLLAATMLGTTGDGYQRVGGGIGAEREARSVFSQISLDLATAQPHDETLFVRQNTSWALDRIGFLSLQPDAAQSEAGRVGDLCAVNYYVTDLQLGGKTVRCLMRGFRESGETFQAIRENKVAQLFTPRTNTSGATLDEPIAFGVVSFQARPMIKNDSGSWIEWDGAQTDPPVALDVRLIIARRDLAAKLLDAADWDGAVGRAAKLLGSPEEAETHGNLESFGTLIAFGAHEAL